MFIYTRKNFSIHSVGILLYKLQLCIEINPSFLFYSSITSKKPISHIDQQTTKGYNQPNHLIIAGEG